MNLKLTTITASLIATIALVGCNSDAAYNGGIEVTVVDGYVKNATVTDATGQIASYASSGKYTFSSTPTYPISSTGGALEDTDLTFDIDMSVTDGVTTVISPITTFLGTDSTLLSKFAGLGLGVSTLDEFSVDYVSSENANLAKLSQILYIILKDSTLTSTFKTSVGNSSSFSSLDNMFTLASTDVNASSAFTAQEIIRMNNLLTAVQDYNGTAANMETSINAYKSNLTSESTTVVTHNGITYGTVLSPHTGKTWLDRNIGASQTCTSKTDTNCYGDYFQWGREADGHEKSTSSTSTTQVSAITNVGDTFINNQADWTSVDTDRTQRASNWATTDGSSVCPSGYRVPTITELANETTELTGDDKISNATDVFNDFLGLPLAGWRRIDGSVDTMPHVGTGHSVASTTLGSTDTTIQTFDADGASAVLYTSSAIGFGINVRCIKD